MAMLGPLVSVIATLGHSGRTNLQVLSSPSKSSTNWTLDTGLFADSVTVM